MRKLLLTLIVLALGLGGAFLALSPRAGAHTLLNGTFTGSVGTQGSPDAFAIALNTGSWIQPGTYQFNVTDYSSIHNFDLCAGTNCTGSNSVGTTDVTGTGSVQWTLTLAPGVYRYQCDAHASQLHGQFLVSTTPPVGVTISKVTSTRKLVTVTAKANQPVHFKAWLLKSGKTVATVASPPALAATATLKLKPAKALKPGTYTVQVRAWVSSFNFKVIKKKITVM